MRRSKLIIFISGIIVSLFLFASCGEDKKAEDEPETFEIALITGTSGIEGNSFLTSAWEAVESFSEEYEMTCQQVHVEAGSGEEDMIESCRKAVEKARSQGGKVMVFAGDDYETAVHALQSEYEDTYFILIDGVPRDKDYNYKMSANSTGVLFAEEEAGFLAGYAAVADGYSKLGFMGGKEIPPVKRYCYGFLQGASAAAKDSGASGVEIKYEYTETFDEEDWILKEAQGWYKDGTQVIFACGGSIGNSVMKAAEYSGGKVIGVDTDQSALSESVITSAKKEIKRAVYDIMKTYIHDNFKGNSIFNFSLENKGISLEMINARFNKFSSAEYNDLVKRITGGEIRIEKEMGSKSLEELVPSHIKVTKIKVSR